MLNIGSMAKRTYKGSCFCKEVQFEAELDLAEGTSKCNCTSCWKRRLWSARAKPEAFKSISGEHSLSKPRGGFCKKCGVIPYGFVDAAEWNDGAYVTVNVAALDDLDPAELAKAPVKYLDGLHDDWWSTPAETRHL
jgi:hypothetical protein